jgi:hypothetical protein
MEISGLEMKKQLMNNLIKVFTECIRIIKDTGSVVFNIGDKWLNGNLQLVPYRFAIKCIENKKIKLINEVT